MGCGVWSLTGDFVVDFHVGMASVLRLFCGGAGFGAAAVNAAASNSHVRLRNKSGVVRRG